MSLRLKSLPRDLVASGRANRVLGICAVCFVALGAVLACVLHWNERQNVSATTQFRERFRQSFVSGLIQLGDDCEIERVPRTLVPQFGRELQAPGVSEYVVTASFTRDGTPLWGRWLYTCNASHGDGIFKFGYAEAATPSALPKFPAPGQRYIGATYDLVDGIPVTAGPTATIVGSGSRARANQPFTVLARSDPGTICRLQIFPPDAALTPPPALQPDGNGQMQWTVLFNPKYAGGNVRVIVKCAQPRGSCQLETSTDCPNVEILP